MDTYALAIALSLGIMAWEFGSAASALRDLAKAYDRRTDLMFPKKEEPPLTSHLPNPRRDK
jgi:hypothetical protein